MDQWECPWWGRHRKARRGVGNLLRVRGIKQVQSAQRDGRGAIITQLGIIRTPMITQRLPQRRQRRPTQVTVLLLCDGPRRVSIGPQRRFRNIVRAGTLMGPVLHLLNLPVGGRQRRLQPIHTGGRRQAATTTIAMRFITARLTSVDATGRNPPPQWPQALYRPAWCFSK